MNSQLDDETRGGIAGSVTGDDWTCPCTAEGTGGLAALTRHIRVLHGERQIVPLHPDLHEIRAWALANGYQVGTRGRLPSHVKDAYWEARS